MYMKLSKLHALIDRAIGTKGVFNRIPAWWMNKILSDIVDNMIPISRDFSNDFNEDFSI